jgi:predicted nucleic acid-binding protein
LNFVVDASVALAWCFEDEGGDYALGVLEKLLTSEAVVASHWTLEVSNALLSAERNKRIDAQSASRFSGLLLTLPIAVDPTARARALTETRRLARTHKLTSYDAAYLELAMRLGVPLATLDKPLKTAAIKEGVPLLAVG